MNGRALLLLSLVAGCHASAHGGPVAPGKGGVGGNGGERADMASATPPSARTPPAHGTLLGAFVGVGSGGPNDFVAEEMLIDRRWVIDNRFYSYEDFIADGRTQWDIAQKKLPLITWEPHWPLDGIIAGTYDDIFHQRARGLRDFGVDILLRWGHEMNGNWYPWAGANNGNAAGPAKYIAAYRHVHDLFVADGATNVYWVWCPLVADVPAEAWNHWANYYPGDDYVDWVGIDSYNWGTSSSCCTWQSWTELSTDLYKDYAGRKPIIVAETASAEVGGDKAAWIADLHQQLETNFTAIKALVWFDINKETDWRIASSPPTLAAYKAMALDPYFNP